MEYFLLEGGGKETGEGGRKLKGEAREWVFKSHSFPFLFFQDGRNHPNNKRTSKTAKITDP